MDIQKIKELALANGFKLKEQASGNMDLNAYVYDFANAVEQETKAQAVPEGYQLVKKELNAELMYAVAGTDDINEHLWIEQIYKGLLKAQEPANV